MSGSETETECGFSYAASNSSHVSSPGHSVASSKNSTKKRAADDETNASSSHHNHMTKTAAAQAFGRLMQVMPVKPKKQSIYVRFKAILLQNARGGGHTDIVKKIASVAKEEWNKVKNVASTNNGENTCNVQNPNHHLVVIKAQAERNAFEEEEKYVHGLKSWSEQFSPVAASHLMWLTIEASSSQVQSLQKAVRDVKTIGDDWPVDVVNAHASALQKAEEELKSFQAAAADRDLVNQLRGASDGVLMQHAKRHHMALDQVQELHEVKAQLAKLLKEKGKLDENKSEQDSRLVNSLMGEISSGLKKRMVYQSGLKYGGKSISFKRTGVSLEVFSQVFEVAAGTKEARMDGPMKSIRYGYMECLDVKVKVTGTGVLTASTKYRIA